MVYMFTLARLHSLPCSPFAQKAWLATHIHTMTIVHCVCAKQTCTCMVINSYMQFTITIAVVNNYQDYCNYRR